MNYMKILLIYMAAMMSMAVQSTTAPVVTPEPTPTAVVEVQGETPAAPATGDVKATPAAPEASHAPVPEITPNKKYRTLQRNSSGKDVRALQERLIELGYLPAGSADGVYGNQTAKAVRKFQENNGLTKDGIAGRTTQTYLFENPDVNTAFTPAPTEEPTPTPKPTETATAEEIPPATPAPTETSAPTEAPTAEPTAEITMAPTEEPTAEPTAEPTEALTAEPTEAPTEKPTDTPTPTDTPAPTEAPTPERTASAPVTSAPATETPVAKPTMTVEEIDLSDLNYIPVEGSVAYNETGSPLAWETLEDGVTVKKTPRLQTREGKIRVSLDDLNACLPEWVLTDEGNSIVLEAEGHILALLNEDAGMAATLDGKAQPITREDFSFAEGHYIDASFLAEALGGKASWIGEEHTLRIRIPAE